VDLAIILVWSIQVKNPDDDNDDDDDDDARIGYMINNGNGTLPLHRLC